MKKINLFPPKSQKSFSIDAEFLTLKLKELDYILLTKALMNHNCSLRQLLFEGNIRQAGDLYHIDFKDAVSGNIVTLTSTYVVIAIGCQNDRILCKMRELPYKQPDLVAFRGYYSAKWGIADPTVFFFNSSRKGYFWAFPMGKDLFNVGCGSKNGKTKIDLKKVLTENIEKLNNDFAVQGSWVIEPKGAMLRSMLSNYEKMCSVNIIFAGESIGSTYPFTGEGIGKALETGIIAAESILESFRNGHVTSAEKFAKEISKDVIPYYKPYIIAEKVLTNPIISKIAFMLICRSSRIQKTISSILSEANYPFEFSFGKMILKLLKKKKRK